MSDSIHPWIGKYLITSAESHGSDIAAIPLTTTKKSVQLDKFLTDGPQEVIWARVSDKEYTIPTRFSREAIQEYTKLSGSDIVKDRNAIISITSFRPFFGRIPQKGRMSAESFLALECASVTLVGARGEPLFGKPEPLETNINIKEWSEGLKQHGGAANCLKDRKQAMLQTDKQCSLVPPIKRFGPPSLPYKPNKHLAVTAVPTSSGHIFQEVWPIVKKSNYRRPPDDVLAILASMKVGYDDESLRPPHEEPVSSSKQRRSSPLLTPSLPAASATHISQDRSRSATPLSEAEWPPSEAQCNQTPVPSEFLISSPNRLIVPSSYPSPYPTPAQRRCEALSPASSPNDFHSLVRNSESLLESHPLKSSNTTFAQDTVLNLPSTLSPAVYSHHISRKVPRPPQPFKSDRLLADAIILVEDSDPSLSYSQSQSQSQSQSLSQSLSQPVVLSQLSQLKRKLPALATPDKGVDRSDPRSAVDEESTKPELASTMPILPSREEPPLTVTPSVTNKIAENVTPEQGKQDPSGAAQPADNQEDKLLDPSLSPPPHSNEEEELDSDDAQIHMDLFGSHRRKQKIPLPARKRRGKFLSETGSASTKTVDENEQSNCDDIQIKNDLSAPREVQHDPVAWAAPSFQVTGKGINKRPKRLDASPDIYSERRAAEEGSSSKHDQYSDKGTVTPGAMNASTTRARGIKLERTIIEDSGPNALSRVERKRNAVGEGSFQRSFTTSSENDLSGSQPGTSIKRKRERDGEALSELTNAKKFKHNATVKEEPRMVKRPLKEFIDVKLDGIRLEENLGVVNWEMVYDILVGTGKDRYGDDVD
ncbi:hypothetical protein H0H93_008613 [Arthromyces matolae]|nr:hypothetical protein H0H93_008613 [Arthromyces matolae]